jgi:serine/threonine protein kinase
MMTDTGSLPYRAPESFGVLYGQEVDIWSVGVIAFELFTGRLPF